MFEENPSRDLRNAANKGEYEKVKKILEDNNGHLIALAVFMGHLFKLKIKDHLPKEDTIKILSLGCGSCSDAFVLSKFFKIYGKKIEYYGIDNSKEMLKKAKQLSKYCLEI